MTRKFLMSAVLGTAVLAGLFLSVLWQQDATLQNSVVDLGLFKPIDRAARVFPSGKLLTGHLASQTLLAGPYRLHGTVSVPRGITVRIGRGVTLAAEEDAQLVVEGTLIADRAMFVSNNLHPRRRMWHGITVRNGGSISLHQTTVADASAALTCGARGSLEANNAQLINAAAGLVALPGHNRCVLRNTRIMNAQVGLSFVGGEATAERITFDHAGDAVRVFHEARPYLAHLVVKSLRGMAIRYIATPPLAVTALSLPTGADPSLLVLDGHDAPTHLWRGERYPTGLVMLR